MSAPATLAIGLFVVFAIAKMATLWGRPIAWSPAAIPAYFWQDAAAALIFGAAVRIFGWREAGTGQIGRVGRVRGARAPLVLYGALAGYAALNVPVTRVLSTPLTWPMVRATSATLADSILLYATAMNVALVLGIATAAAILLRLVPAAPPRVRALMGALAMLLVLVGPVTERHVDTLGLHRNALAALGGSLLARVDAVGVRGDWTSIVAPVRGAAASPNDASLSSLRGIAKGRNVVLVSLESTAAQYLRLYGAAEDVTPQLDALARSGVVVDNAYAVYPESIKGLFSVLCSTYPAFETAPAMYAYAPCPSIAERLAQSGYRNALFHSGRFGYLGMNDVIRNRGYHVLEDAGDIGGNHESSFGVDEPSTVARALAWIDTLPAGQRFFLTYLPIAGHHPYETPERGPFGGEGELGRYRNALHYADRALGSLIAGLRARGLDRDTLWVVVGDHGEAMGQHEANYGHTFFLYEENVRVPFVVAVPGAIANMERSRAIISLVDTAPTILDLLGLPIPADVQGHSLLDPRPRMALFFTDYSLRLLGVRDGRWKLVHELESGRSKLFDLEGDPAERIDLASQHHALVLAYENRLRAWSAAQKGYLLRAGRQVGG